MDYLILWYITVGLTMRLTDKRVYHSELHILCSALIWPLDWSRKR